MERLLMIIIAIILPPVAVFLKEKLSKNFIINIVLCFLFWIPGVIHALWVLLK